MNSLNKSITNFTYIRYKNKHSHSINGYVSVKDLVDINSKQKIEVAYWILIGMSDYILEKKIWFTRDNKIIVQNKKQIL